ncbi:MAG: HEPN domain-containing protein [bacterium]
MTFDEAFRILLCYRLKGTEVPANDPRETPKSIRNWIAGSDYDLTTAKHMLDTGRYIYVVFMCHLALEKMLKAHVELHEDKAPPKIHHLKMLADRSGLKIPDKFKDIILELNETSIPTRYPEELQSSLAVFT